MADSVETLGVDLLVPKEGEEFGRKRKCEQEEVQGGVLAHQEE